MSPNKDRVFSGARPTGRQHLGNYLGAVKNYVALQDQFTCVYCIVDLHALTILPDPERDEAGHLAAMFGYPRWMVARWLSRHGRERTERILEWGNTPPCITVRLNPTRTGGWPLPDAEAARVFRSCGDFVPGEVPGTYRVVAEVAPSELPGLAEGSVAVGAG